MKINRIHYPKPKKLFEELELDFVEKHRKFDCIFYDFCLDYAVDFVYLSFSCIGCNYYCKLKKINKGEKNVNT